MVNLSLDLFEVPVGQADSSIQHPTALATTELIWPHPSSKQGFPVTLVLKNLPAEEGDVRDTGGFDTWVGKIPWWRSWQPTPVLLPGESHRGGAWWPMVHRV